MRSYQDLIGELKNKNIKPLHGEFYMYEEFPLQEEFERFYNFCQEYLERDDLGINIKPAIFFFNTNTLENALAYIKDGYSLVEIFKGAIFELHNFYNSKQTSFETEFLKTYEQIVQKKKINASYFLFQYVTLFFLYHEVGHLIQRSIGSKDYIEFAQSDREDNDVVVRHIREHDADWFASNQLAFHIIQFSKGIEFINNNEFQAFISKMTSLALAGVYTNFIRWSINYSKIYYQEHCHPHPSIRLSYIIIYLLDALKENFAFDLDYNNILTDAIKISEIIMVTNDKNIIEEYSVQLSEQLDQVEEYINKIRKDAETYPYLSQKVVVR